MRRYSPGDPFTAVARAHNTPTTQEKDVIAGRLFIGNLPYDVTEAELRAHFAAVGQLASLALPTDCDTGKPRGFARRQQALVEQASRAAEEERQRVFTVVQQHCPTSGAPLVTVTYRSIVIDKRSRCQGIWLDCDEFLFFGEALERVLAKDQWLLGALKRSLT